MVVKVRALHTLEAVVTAAADFMRSRVYSDALPLLQLMLRPAPLPGETNISDASKLRFTVGYRLEQSALAALQKIASDLELTEDVGASVAEACIP